MKTQQKSLKPISIDAHFKYRCSNEECSIEHWLSLKETQTKNFKVVCDCGAVFSPKRISRLKILYKKSNKAKNTKPAQPAEQPVIHKEPSIEIPVDILDKSAKILTSYGFTDKEARQLLVDSYVQVKNNDIGALIKFTLEKFGGKHG